MELRQFVDELMPAFQEMELSEEPAKTYNPERNLIDQSMWEHIRSGVEACLALLDYLGNYELEFDTEELKIAIIAFILHDLHKDPSIKKTGTSEYSLPLEEVERICYSLCKAVDTTIPPAAFLRVAGVSSFSNKLGDLSTLSDQYNWTYIRDWVGLMDQMASITSIAECIEEKTIHNLKQRLSQLLPPKLVSKLRIEFHYIQEMRGMLTSQIHNGMALLMKRYGYYPWVRFGDGTLYISFESEELPTTDRLYEDLIDLFFQSISQSAEQVDKKKLLDTSTFECQPSAYMLFNSPEGFARLFHHVLVNSSTDSRKFVKDKLEDRLQSYEVNTLEELFTLKNELAKDDELRDKWFYTARYFAALQRLVQRMESISQDEALQKMADYFRLPVDDLLGISKNNRRYDGAIWLAARFLKTTDEKGRPAAHLSLEEWRMKVKERAVEFLTGVVTLERCQQIVDDKLKVKSDLQQYFSEQLTLSWERKRAINLLDTEELLNKKTSSQKSICNLCNRQIQVKDRILKRVKSKVIQDTVNVYSNRLLPKKGNVSALHWCSICFFEFFLRQVFAVDSYNKDDNTPRIHLFAVPSFQLTEEVLGDLQRELKNFYGTIQVHRNFKLAEVWQAPFVEESGGHLRDYLREHFQIYSDFFQEELFERGFLSETGEVLKASPPGNVLLFTFDWYGKSIERTREEMWLKALTAALSLHKIYGFRIYMTEKPFLFISDVREIHHAIHMDAPPYKVARLLGKAEERQTSDFVVPIKQTKSLLYRLAYLWEIHQTVHPLDTKKSSDKQVSTILQKLDVHPIPGAYFFKRYLSENKYRIEETFIKACQKINQDRGGDEMGLAKEIALASLALYKPKKSENGMAYRYENLFRLVVKGIKEGRDKSELQGSVLKRLKRLRDQNARSVPEIDTDLIAQFVDLVYDRFYLERCGHNLAKLNQKENQLADGIFFETFLVLDKGQKNEDSQEEE